MTRQVFLVCAAVVLGGSSAAAQEASQPAAAGEPKAMVTIGDTTAPPEWDLSVPLSVEVTEGSEVGRLSMRFVYPVQPLRYVGVKGTETLTGAGFAVTATAAVKGEIGSVTLEFEPAEKKPAALPSGRVAILQFKVAVDAEEKGWPMTAEDVQAWGRGPNGPTLVAAAKGPATFTVASAGLPIFACFFYMH